MQIRYDCYLKRAGGHVGGPLAIQMYSRDQIRTGKGSSGSILSNVFVLRVTSIVVVVHVLDVRCVVLEMLEVSMSAMQRCDAVKTMELRLFCKKKYKKSQYYMMESIHVCVIIKNQLFHCFSKFFYIKKIYGYF